MRSLFIVTLSLLTVSTVCADTTEEHGSHVRFEVNTSGSSLVRAQDTVAGSITYEVVGRSDRVVEAFVGYTFQPISGLRLITFVGTDVEHERVDHVIPFVLIEYQDGGNIWRGESWNLLLIQPRNTHESVLEERLWLARNIVAGTSVGPHVVAEFPFNGVGSATAGGVMARTIGETVQILLSAGKQIGEHHGVGARLDFIYTP